ncbi:MAG: tRNA-guanine transglycosylase, partial [Holosporales bacterium]
MVSLYPQFHFHLTHESSRSLARTGSLMTPHGSIETPAFIFCATKATLKGLTMDQVRATGASIILSNTYHLMLQPGPDVVDRLGGLHSFMNWQGPLLTDSGGFQIFSLGYGSVADEIKGRKTVQRPPHVKGLTEEGALFKSYLNGDIHLLTPEKSIEVQQKLGADLIVVLDECTPFHVDK